MKLLPILLLTLLSACTSINVNTNASSHVKNHIRKSVVKTYTNQEVWTLGATRVGYVDTQHCQVNVRESIPSKRAFISKLKVKTQKLGGNALVFDACVVNSTANCNTQTLCRGTAYLVTN